MLDERVADTERTDDVNSDETKLHNLVTYRQGGIFDQAPENGFVQRRSSESFYIPLSTKQ